MIIKLKSGKEYEFIDKVGMHTYFALSPLKEKMLPIMRDKTFMRLTKLQKEGEVIVARIKADANYKLTEADSAIKKEIEELSESMDINKTMQLNDIVIQMYRILIETMSKHPIVFDEIPVSEFKELMKHEFLTKSFTEIMDWQ